jgi:peptide/nickel transport system permease protein
MATQIIDTSKSSRRHSFTFFWQQTRARWKRIYEVWDLFRRRPLGLLGLFMIIGFGLMVFIHPLLLRTVWNRARYDPIIGFDVQQMPHPTAPTPQHLFGTDNFGRDVLSQVIFGAKVSFGVGLTAAVIAVTISTTMGGAAGYFEELPDTVLMGIADVFVLLPAPIVLLIFGLLVQMPWPVVALMYGLLTGLGGQAVIVKSHTLSLKVKPYIEAARVAGGGHLHIILKHILPGLLPLSIVNGVFTVVGAVLTESLLSYFSRTQYYMSWGSIIWLGQETFRVFDFRGQWHAIIPPAMAIMLFCSAFYLVGRSLDDIVNPRLRQR